MNEKLKIIPLGGLGEVGRNMTVIQYGDAMIVIDCGLMFPESDMPGVDLVLPNFTYLAENVEHLLGYFITHGHEDHHGALGHVLPQAPAPIYATRLTRGLIEVRLKEHKLLDSAVIHTVEHDDVIEIGPFRIEPIRVAHSIPDAVGYAVHTPLGTVVHSAEYKFDLTPVMGNTTDIHKLARLGEAGVLALLSDSTNAERAGWTPSESIVRETLERVFERAEGRIIIATFASNISRVQEVINVAEEFERRVGLVGRSMENNGEMAHKLGYLESEPGTLASIGELDGLPDDEVVICCTGTRGEPTSALVRMADGRHPRIKLRPGDTVVLSASPIPGNEELVHRTLDNLFRQGAHVLYQALAPVHVSGHASREELKLMLKLTSPRYFIPSGGEYRMLALHKELAEELGMPSENIFVIESGQVLEFDANGVRHGDSVPGGYIFVDGSGIGDIGEAVLRERRSLSFAGFVIVNLVVDAQSGEVKDLELMTRGWVYRPESEAVLSELEDFVRRMVRGAEPGGNLSELLRKRVGDLVYERTRRRPMVMVSVLEA